MNRTSRMLPPLNHSRVSPLTLSAQDFDTIIVLAVVRRIRREVDAGSVHMDDASDGGGTLTLPPAYEDLPPRQRPSRRQGRK